MCPSECVVRWSLMCGVLRLRDNLWLGTKVGSVADIWEDSQQQARASSVKPPPFVPQTTLQGLDMIWGRVALPFGSNVMFHCNHTSLGGPSEMFVAEHASPAEGVQSTSLS